MRLRSRQGGRRVDLVLGLLLIAAAPSRAEAPETPFAEVFSQLAAKLVGVVVNVSTSQAPAAAPAKGGPENQPPPPGAPDGDA